MNIGIIDADLLDNGTRHPNLALMKISGYYKEYGHVVELITEYENMNLYDKIFISKVFSYTKIPKNILNSPNITIGGTGFFVDGGENLNDAIEHHMPDYDLYQEYVQEKLTQGKLRTNFADYLDYSIGFTTRGCFRRCDFCVNKKYDKPFKHSPVSEFLDKTRPYIYLWDDNFLSYKGWEDILNDIEKTGKPFQFRQGLDIRLLTELMAKRLSKTKYHGDFIFAFDHIRDKELIEQKLKLWRRYSTKTTKLYILCAFESQDENDVISVFERIKILMKYGCLPYIMRYEEYKHSTLKVFYTQLARWCNQPQFFKKKSFRQFCEANQDYHKNTNTICASYQSMLDFEKQYPDTAKKYFDLRFDEENQYTLFYGRKYSYKKDCSICLNDQKTWVDAYLGKVDIKTLLVDYFSKEIDLECLLYLDSQCQEIRKEILSKWFAETLVQMSWEDVWLAINELVEPEDITQANIPQFSNLKEAVITVPIVLYKSGLSLTFDDMGYYLNGRDKNTVACRKYGENHSKFAALIDLCVIKSPSNYSKIGMSILGKAFCSINESCMEALAAKLMFRIPIIQKLFLDAKTCTVKITDYLDTLSDTTKIRRKPNIIEVIDFIEGHSSGTIKEICKNII